METPASSLKPHIKVCAHTDCSSRGSDRVYEALRRICSEEMDIRKTPDCFRFCREGINVSVNGQVLHRVREGDAVLRVRREVQHPSKKMDGVGSRSLDDLDDVLDGLVP